MKYFLFIALILSSITAFHLVASENEIKTLDAFKSVADFEVYVKKLEELCLEDKLGGVEAKKCILKNLAWKRSEKHFQAKLRKKLDDNSKRLLDEFIYQHNNLELSIIMINRAVLDSKYKGNEGAMFDLMYANDLDNLMAIITKSKVLYYKRLLDSVEGPIPSGIDFIINLELSEG